MLCWDEDEKLIVVSNFDKDKAYEFDLKIPEDIVSKWQLKNASYSIKEQLYGDVNTILKVENNIGTIKVNLEPLESYIFSLEEN